MQTAAVELGGMLREWHIEKCQNGNLGWSNLAKKAGMSPSYLSKLASGAVKLPSFEKAKSIYKVLRPEDVNGLYEFLKANYPNKTPAYESFYDKEINSISPDCAEHLSDPISFRILKIALAEEFTREELLEMFCAKDLDVRLKTLEVDGFISFNSEKKLCRGANYKRTVSTERANVASQFEHSLAMLIKKKSENELHGTPYDTKANTMSFYHDALNDKGTAKLYDLSLEFIQTAHKILSNPEYKGNIPVFVNLMTGRFDSL